jgi:hypothetical protein
MILQPMGFYFEPVRKGIIDWLLKGLSIKYSSLVPQLSLGAREAHQQEKTEAHV